MADDDSAGTFDTDVSIGRAADSGEAFTVVSEAFSAVITNFSNGWVLCSVGTGTGAEFDSLRPGGRALPADAEDGADGTTTTCIAW